MNQMFVGLDLGQASDFTAIAVLESDDSDPRTYQLRHLDRWRGVPYPAIVEKVRAVVDALPEGSTLVLDATGVGAAVTDMVREARLNAEVVAVLIHGGDKTTRDGSSWRVPKRDLVAVVSVLLETGRLKIASRLTHAKVLTDELRSFRVKIDSATAHDSYASWREADHDDLVLAVALACYVAEDPASRPVILTASSFGFFEEELSWGGD
jgi:threonine dehydrogenase-like Zn-dependent dehydrogenase